MAPRDLSADVDLAYSASGLRRGSYDAGGEGTSVAARSVPLSPGSLKSRQDKRVSGSVGVRRWGAADEPALRGLSEDTGWPAESSSSSPLDKSRRAAGRRRGGTGPGSSSADTPGALTRADSPEPGPRSSSSSAQASLSVSSRHSPSPKAAPGPSSRPRSPTPSLRAVATKAPPAWAPAPAAQDSSLLMPSLDISGHPQGTSALSSRPASPNPAPMSATQRPGGFRGSSRRGPGASPSGSSPSRLGVMDSLHRRAGDRPGSSGAGAWAFGGRGSPSALHSPGTVPGPGSPQPLPLGVGARSLSSSADAGDGGPGDLGHMLRDAMRRTQRFALPEIGNSVGSLQRTCTEGVASLLTVLDKGREQGQVALERMRSAAFERVDGERSYCPRCRGSGLLGSGQSAALGFSGFGWVLGSASRRSLPVPTGPADPCWFCQGIGVMPILDLEGFVVARSPVLVSSRAPLPAFTATPRAAMSLDTGAAAGALWAATAPVEAKKGTSQSGQGQGQGQGQVGGEQQPPSPAAPVSPLVPQGLLPLYLGKFPEARCSFRTSRLPRLQRKLLFASLPRLSPLTLRAVSYLREAMSLSQVARPPVPPPSKPAPALGQGPEGQSALQMPLVEAVCGACGASVAVEVSRCPTCAVRLVLREEELGVEKGAALLLLRPQSARARARQLWEQQREQEAQQRARSDPRRSAANAGGAGAAEPGASVGAARGANGRAAKQEDAAAAAAAAGAADGGKKGSRSSRGGALKRVVAVICEGTPNDPKYCTNSPRLPLLRKHHQVPLPASAEGATPMHVATTPGPTTLAGSAATLTGRAAALSCAACAAGARHTGEPAEAHGRWFLPPGQRGSNPPLRHTCGSRGQELGPRQDQGQGQGQAVGAAGGDLNDVGSPRLTGMRSPRRMERNKIREQAERHAVERARWRQHQLLVSPSVSPRRHCLPSAANSGAEYCRIGDEEGLLWTTRRDD